ncbi:MAG: beta strand repeat-containing protein, partial [Solirubrobacteraceae bacterium]
MTFAPGSLPDNAYVSVTLTSGAADGLGAGSTVYNLSAIDAVTGASIEHFAIAPVLSIGVGAASGGESGIYYLPTDGAPQAIASTYDPATGQVSAGLPHFSAYAVLPTIQGYLEQYAAGTLTGPQSFTLASLSIGGVVTLVDPTLSFSISSFSGTGSTAIYSGTISFSANSASLGASPVTASFGGVSGTYTLVSQTADAGTLSLTLQSASFTLAGVASLSAGSVQVTTSDNGTTTTTTLGATGVNATIGAASGPAFSITNGTFGVAVQTADSGTGSPAAALQATGDVSFRGLSTVSLNGSGWSLQYDALGDLSASPISVATGGTPVVLDFAQPNGVTGPWTAFSSGTALSTFTIAGQDLSGQFNAAVNGAETDVTASDVGLSIGPSGSPYVSVPNSTTGGTGASGELIVTGAGIAGDLTVPNVTVALPGVNAASLGQVQIQVNTQPTPVSETFAGSTTPVALPAGPYVGVQVDNLKISATSGPLSGGQLSGSVLFEQNAGVTVLGLSGLSVTLPSQSSPVVSNGSGLLIVQSTGIAGYVTGTAAAGTGGSSISGQVTISLNTTGGAVNQTVMLGGQQLTVAFGAGEGDVFNLSVSGLSIDIGGVATLQGNVTLGSFTTSAADGSLQGQSFAGTDLSVFFGQGPAYLADGSLNPLAVGLLITNATVGLFESGSGSSTQYAFTASGTAQLVGVPGVTAAGTITINVNSFSQAFSELLSIPGGGTVPLDLATGGVDSAGLASSSVSGTGLNFSAGGQAFSGDLTATDSNGSILLGLQNVSLALGGDPGDSGP